MNEAQFALNRQMLTQKYEQDLQRLANSSGWQGAFGGQFQNLLRGDEALLRQWSSSTNQSLMLVQVSLQSLKQIGAEAFQKMAEGMGGGIAQAVVYSQSIGAAMRAATAATLESIAAQAMTEAIYSLAWGFMDLAQGNFAGAEAAFQAAALFGSVGVASAVAGRAVAPASASGAGGTGAGGRVSGGGGSSGAVGAGGGGIGGAGKPRVTVNVYGHVVGVAGVEQLTSMINDAVQNRDVRLVASQVRQGTLATF